MISSSSLFTNLLIYFSSFALDYKTKYLVFIIEADNICYILLLYNITNLLKKKVY